MKRFVLALLLFGWQLVDWLCRCNCCFDLNVISHFSHSYGLSTDLFAEMYQEQKKNGNDAEVWVRSVRIPIELKFDLETCVLFFWRMKILQPLTWTKKIGFNKNELRLKYGLSMAEICLIGKLFTIGFQ